MCACQACVSYSLIMWVLSCIALAVVVLRIKVIIKRITLQKGKIFEIVFRNIYIFQQKKMGKLKNRVHILVVLFICVAQAKIELRKYKKLGPGQNITGTILEEFTSKSKLKCSDRLV